MRQNCVRAHAHTHTHMHTDAFAKAGILTHMHPKSRVSLLKQKTGCQARRLEGCEMHENTQSITETRSQ